MAAWAVVIALGALAAGWAWFARDPERKTPAAPGLVVAPADGRVLLVEQVAASTSDPDGAWRIAIFLSLLDVHVQRAPEAGLVSESVQRTGGYAPAMKAAAAHNAGHWLGLDTAAGPMRLLRTAGLVARRVTTEVEPGDRVRRGQRIGRIWLGSRAEVYLPRHLQPTVSRGQRVIAGETVIARATNSEA